MLKIRTIANICGLVVLCSTSLNAASQKIPLEDLTEETGLPTLVLPITKENKRNILQKMQEAEGRKQDFNIVLVPRMHSIQEKIISSTPNTLILETGGPVEEVRSPENFPVNPIQARLRKKFKQKKKEEEENKLNASNKKEVASATIEEEKNDKPLQPQFKLRKKATKKKASSQPQENNQQVEIHTAIPAQEQPTNPWNNKGHLLAKINEQKQK